MQQLVHLSPQEDSIFFLLSFYHLFVSTYIKLFHAVVISWTAGSNHFPGRPIFSVGFYFKINAFLPFAELYFHCIFLLLSRSQEAYCYFMTQGTNDSISTFFLKNNFTFQTIPSFWLLQKWKLLIVCDEHLSESPFKSNQPRVPIVDVTWASRRESREDSLLSLLSWVLPTWAKDCWQKEKSWMYCQDSQHKPQRFDYLVGRVKDSGPLPFSEVF